MGKQGPCYHCGVTSTPLWRNGPPEKPVLCNACGSRWRTKGTLANYTPLHARVEPEDYEDHRASRLKSISINKNKEVKLLKRKPNYDTAVVAPDYNQGFRKFVDEDPSNRSSSGSAISNSESCAQFGSADASDLTGPAQSNVWDSMVPSKKRTCINRPKPSSVEKLTKDLYTILHEQQSSYFSGSSEEDLLLESETPMVSVEIGHGSVLIRHPSSIAREEESEASSLSQLLEEGVFNISSPGVKAEDCKTLKRLALFNLTKSRWVERHHATYENEELIDNDGSCFSPRSLFALPPDGSSFVMDSLQFADESSDQVLLLDVPPNGSFPQAELLHPILSFGPQASTSSSSAHPHLVHP
ncbi:hypothetical protein REPUB_Repub07fG0224400 [Reevesia pubescens]